MLAVKQNMPLEIINLKSKITIQIIIRWNANLTLKTKGFCLFK